MGLLRRNFDRDIAHFTPKQLEACKILDSGMCKYFLYGGAMGGGKSYFLRWYGLRRLMWLAEKGFRNAAGMLACETYPDLKNRQLTKIETEFPSWLGTFHDDHRSHGRCFVLKPQYGGGILMFRNLDDADKYKSTEFAFILVDELTNNKYEVFNNLKQRLRWKGLPDMETQFVGGTNPDGIGHGWVKQLWIDRNFPPAFKKPVDHTVSFYFLRSLATDNPHVDADYESSLSMLSEDQRMARKEGRWDIFGGQAFPEITKETHGLGKIVPSQIPQNYNLYTTFDYGYGTPFSWAWWYVDNDGRCVRFAEWYGWNGFPNKGLNYTDDQIAEGVVEREKEMGISDREIYRLAGHDCFHKRANPYATAKGKAVSEVFADRELYLVPADPDRLMGIRQFRNRIRQKVNGMPMLMATTTCEHFFRTLPDLPVKTEGRNAQEDVDDRQGVEDHVYDECRQICMARPTTAEPFEETNYPGNKQVVIEKPEYRDFRLEEDNDHYDIFGLGLN